MDNSKFRGIYRIKSTRLPGYDYCQEGYYYITICIKNKDELLGRLKNDKVVLTAVGVLVERYWKNIPAHFPNVQLDEYIIMPNHIHGIVVIQSIKKNDNNVDPVETGQCPVSTSNANCKNRASGPGLSTIIGSFKSKCSRIIHKEYPQANFSWQSRFYDHVIRDERSLMEIRSYIRNNPINWGIDANGA